MMAVRERLPAPLSITAHGFAHITLMLPILGGIRVVTVTVHISDLAIPTVNRHLTPDSVGDVFRRFLRLSLGIGYLSGSLVSILLVLPLAIRSRCHPLNLRSTHSLFSFKFPSANACPAALTYYWLCIEHRHYTIYPLVDQYRRLCIAPIFELNLRF